MNTIEKKYRRQQKLSVVGMIMVGIMLLFTLQFLEKEETMVAAFFVVCGGVSTVMTLLWYYDNRKTAIKDLRRF